MITRADGTTETQDAYDRQELARLVKERRPITPAMRARILSRDHATCRYCGTTAGPFEIDHVYPVAKGGPTKRSNLVTACHECNNRKGTKAWKPRPLIHNLGSS